MAAHRYRPDDLSRFVETALQSLELTDEDAQLCAEILIDADMRGVGTHGIANFVWHLHYGPGLKDGSIEPRPEIEVLRDSPVAAAWDADRGFGPLVAHRAMTAAIAKADETGIGMITVRNGCHFGAHAYFVDMAAERDMVAMTMTHTMPAAVAPGGLDRVVGTNPLGIGIPSSDDHNFVLDMATTAISGTRAMFAERAGEPLPWGVAVDANGKITTDHRARSGGGSLLPLGSTPEAGVAKGFGLAMVVDLLSGLLSGTGSGLHQSYGPDWGQGYWFMAWRVDLFTDRDDFRAGVAATSEIVRASRVAEGADPIRVPGDRSAEARSRHLVDGVPLSAEVVEMCERFAEDLGVPFPRPLPADGLA